MAESGVETGNGHNLSLDTVMQSIADTEKWWPRLQEIMAQDKGVVEFIEHALKVYQDLEQAASNPDAHFPKTAEETSRIKALWVISAPGTYFKASKNDRYKDKPWAAWNDRQRVNYALHLGRRLAEVKLGHKLGNNWVKVERELNVEGPLIIYNGRPDENAAVLEAAATPWLRIPEPNLYPRDRIMVISPMPPIDNLLDQIKTFRLPRDFKMNSGDEIGVVIHAPQAIRFLYMLNNFPGVIPEGAVIRVFPLPTPETGMQEYPLQELRGLINYRFIANPPIAADTPYPCKY